MVGASMPQARNPGDRERILSIAYRYRTGALVRQDPQRLGGRNKHDPLAGRNEIPSLPSLDEANSKESIVRFDFLYGHYHELAVDGIAHDKRILKTANFLQHSRRSKAPNPRPTLGTIRGCAVP